MPIHAQEWFRKEAERNITAEILRCGAGYEAKAPDLPLACRCSPDSAQPQDESPLIPEAGSTP